MTELLLTTPATATHAEHASARTPAAATVAASGALIALADATHDHALVSPSRPRQTASIASLRRGIAALGARPSLLLAGTWLALVGVAAIAPQLIAPGDPLSGIAADHLQAPSFEHPFGTDQTGRDVLTRVVHGTALTLGSSLIAVAVGLVIGSLLGFVAGFVGRWVDDVIMRIADVLLSIPSLLLSLALIAVLGVGTRNIAIAVGIASVASVARIMRAEVLRVRTSAYVEAARVSGNTWLRTLVRHVVPNSFGPVVVLATLELGTAILAVSALSFLGYGAAPPAPEWGTLVAGGRDALASAWWLTTLPGLTIALTVLAANRLARSAELERSVRA